MASIVQDGTVPLSLNAELVFEQQRSELVQAAAPAQKLVGRIRRDVEDAGGAWQFIRLAGQHGYIIVSLLGFTRMDAYGTPLRLPAVFGNPEAAAQQGFAGRGFKLEYMEVDADHGGMIPLVLPGIFKFFDRCRSK